MSRARDCAIHQKRQLRSNQSIQPANFAPVHQCHARREGIAALLLLMRTHGSRYDAGFERVVRQTMIRLSRFVEDHVVQCGL